MTREQYFAEAVKRYGEDQNNWKFRCPSCESTMTVADYMRYPNGDALIAFSCIGRLMPHAVDIGIKPGPCNYAGGGLFRFNPIDVDGEKFFDFADDPLKDGRIAE